MRQQPRLPSPGSPLGSQGCRDASIRAASSNPGRRASLKRERGRKAKGRNALAWKRRNALACDVHAKQPTPVDTAGVALRKSGPSLPRREKFERGWRLVTPQHTAAPCPAQAAPWPPHTGLSHPTAVLLQRKKGSGRAGLGMGVSKSCLQPLVGTGAVGT